MRNDTWPPLMRWQVCVTRAVDVWAMGLVLYHFFAGSSLWGDVEVDEAMVANQPEEAVRRLELDGSLPAGGQERRLLREMIVVDATRRKPLREILAKAFFKEGEDTEQASHIEVRPGSAAWHLSLAA
eukprot:3914778-Prymnesium_polylepis.1